MNIKNVEVVEYAGNRFWVWLEVSGRVVVGLEEWSTIPFAKLQLVDGKLTIRQQAILGLPGSYGDVSQLSTEDQQELVRRAEVFFAHKHLRSLRFDLSERLLRFDRADTSLPQDQRDPQRWADVVVRAAYCGRFVAEAKLNTSGGVAILEDTHLVTTLRERVLAVALRLEKQDRVVVESGLANPWGA